MRWERLIEEIQARIDQEEADRRAAEAAELQRAERARLRLPMRLRAQVGARVRVVLRQGRLLDGEIADAGADWVTIAGDPRGAVVVPVAAMVQIDGLGWESGAESIVASRLGLGHPLRRLARDRAVVEVEDVLGRQFTGTIDIVGADAFELAAHAREVPPRRADVTGRPTIPFAAVVCITAVGPA